ncbi:MAG: cupin domain-containing protein [Melioribacteraceae bacterium]|jgi:quercetin dioxygenase-like cupin family protein|nr:cupin domain-containing protein [Ignavibacteriaceae bacterium]MBZ0182885.1 cupin domain-containing protein [Melioribacteraceae bacterium]
MENNNRTEVLKANDLLRYQDEAVISRTLVKKSTGSITLFAFDKGQGLSEHTAPFDALAHIIDGEAEIVVDGEVFNLMSNEMIIMPANKTHALKALSKFKLLLTMIRS